MNTRPKTTPRIRLSSRSLGAVRAARAALASLCLAFAFVFTMPAAVQAATKHSPGSAFPTYKSLAMCGYQGWFRAQGDGSGRGWTHYTTRGQFTPATLKVDLWPDISEYEKTYPTPFTNRDGTIARVFSSWDKSTVDLHFRWMRQYGIDGVFMQRFFDVTRTEKSRRDGNVILGHALNASQSNSCAIAVMYDLSGLRAKNENCDSLIEDWKQLIDTLNLTTRGPNQTYLYHRGKPLVAIWGIGFPDRPYNIRDIGLDKLIDFLKNDSQYGGCSIMLGVPTYFRNLNTDCLPDPYLHEIMAKADIIMPWMVQRFSPLLHNEKERFAAHIKADIAWCTQRNLDYAPCVYPGFSWYNLSRQEFGGRHPIDQTPRQGGRFYCEQIATAINSGAKMLYVAMFDEIDEGTAIFKCSNEPPIPGAPAKLVSYEGVPTDHYLWLTGQASQMLRGKIPVSADIYLQTNHTIKTSSPL